MMIFLFVLCGLLAANYCRFIYEINLGLLNILGAPEKKRALPEASIIVAFRNEENALPSLIEDLRLQDYDQGKLEVILVNDSSTDRSLEVCGKIDKPDNFHILSLEGRTGKKEALKKAMEKASGEIILTTDADCRMKPSWARTVASFFSEDTSMVSSSVDFHSGGGIFKNLQRLEFSGLCLAGAGLIGKGQPVLCSGANLAYRRDLFFRVGGFDDNMAIASGDDQFLMLKFARLKDYRVKFCAQADAIVRTSASENLKDFFSQRKRWAGKTVYFDDKKLVLKLSLIFLFYAILFVLPAVFLFDKAFFFLFLGLFAFKAFFEFNVLWKTRDFGIATGCLKYFFLAEFLQIPYIVLSVLGGLIFKIPWKGRRIKN